MKDIHKLKKLVGGRYETLNELKCDIEKTIDRKVNAIIFSESEIVDNELDNMIDCEFDEDGGDMITIWYLFDNAKKIYITEI